MIPRRRTERALTTDQQGGTVNNLAELAVASGIWSHATHRYVQAIWDSDLPPKHRLLALAYAYQADRDGSNLTRLTYAQIKQRTGITSNGAITAAIRALTTTGWLRPESDHQPRGRHARYQLTTPEPGEHPNP